MFIHIICVAEDASGWLLNGMRQSVWLCCRWNSYGKNLPLRRLQEIRRPMRNVNVATGDEQDMTQKIIHYAPICSSYQP